MLDLSSVLGQPYITVTDYVYAGGGVTPVQRDAINPNFILGFILLLFLTVFLTNIVIRLFFRRK